MINTKEDQYDIVSDLTSNIELPQMYVGRDASRAYKGKAIKYFENMERVEKSKKLCENREFWTEKMIPLMKEESSDFESSCELEDRLDEVNEIGFRYPTSFQLNQ